jgi:hypothetical protein
MDSHGILFQALDTDRMRTQDIRILASLQITNTGNLNCLQITQLRVIIETVKLLESIQHTF